MEGEGRKKKKIKKKKKGHRGSRASSSLHSKMYLVCGSLLAILGIASFLSVPPLHTFAKWPFSTPLPMELTSLMPHSSDVSAFYAFSSKNIWTSDYAKFYYGCSSPSKFFPRRVPQIKSNGYILVETSGGLNQQRIGIMDAVVVARILNATLLLPELDHESFWKDSSNFSDIFDPVWFSAMLAPDVAVIAKLPASVKIPEELFYSMRVPRKSLPNYYLSRVLPILKRRKVVRFTKFDYRLANDLDDDLQKLRCRVNYHALQFRKKIQDLGEALVRRLVQGNRRYIAVHLRFEPDMLAFSGCYFGGGEKEIQELRAIRQRWEVLMSKDPEKQRRNGKCPLTPEEVGFVLHALGFESDSCLYIASGEVYGGEQTLAPLKALFPNVYTKDSLASKDELQPFSSYSSQMAAVDYIVCEKSDVFITNNNGNMARILAGRRRYFGHKRTIRPNVRKLGSIFLERSNMTWDLFASKIRKAQRGFLGEPDEIRPGRGETFEYPGACICENPELKDELEALKQLQRRARENRRKEEGANQNSELQVQNQTWHEDTKILHNIHTLIEHQMQNQSHYGDTMKLYHIDEMLETDEFKVQEEDLRREHNMLIRKDEVDLDEMPWLSD